MTATARNRNVATITAALLVGLAIALTSVNKAPKVPEIDVPGAKALIDAGAVVVDVRETDVSAGSHIPGALLIPLGIVAQRMKELSIDTIKPVVVYCGDGSHLGPDGTYALQQAGYAHAVNLKSGIQGWRAAGMPTASN